MTRTVEAAAGTAAYGTLLAQHPMAPPTKLAAWIHGPVIVAWPVLQMIKKVSQCLLDNFISSKGILSQALKSEMETNQDQDQVLKYFEMDKPQVSSKISEVSWKYLKNRDKLTFPSVVIPVPWPEVPISRRSMRNTLASSCGDFHQENGGKSPGKSPSICPNIPRNITGAKNVWKCFHQTWSLVWDKNAEKKSTNI